HFWFSTIAQQRRFEYAICVVRRQDYVLDPNNLSIISRTTASLLELVGQLSPEARTTRSGSEISLYRTKQHAAVWLYAALLVSLVSFVCPLVQARGVKAELWSSTPDARDIDYWGEAEGLTQSRIRAIVQTKDAYLWLGTDYGLVRFNGTSFTA